MFSFNFTNINFEILVDADTLHVTLEDILVFFSGSDMVPPLGFSPPPSIVFNHEAMFPTSSTCSLMLVLPTKYHDNYHAFKSKLLFAFKNHGGFGLL